MNALIVGMTFIIMASGASSSNLNINTYIGEDGRSYYTSPLYCGVSSLQMFGYLSRQRSTYTLRSEKNCCYLEDSRHLCCAETSNGAEEGCRCSPSVNCGITTTTATTTARTTTRAPTTVRATTTTTRAPTTTARATTTTTRAPTTARATTTTTRAPTTARATTTTTRAPTTTARTTTTSSTTRAPTTTATSTTTTTTATTTTTTAPKSLCPGNSYRILNGEQVVDDCPYSGVSNITAFDGELSVCNAVFTIATVNGVTKPTFMTTGDCKESIDDLSIDTTLQINFANKKYDISPPAFSTVAGPNGTAFIDVSKEYQSLLNDLGACQKYACGYNATTMNGRVDMSTCKVLSWGTSNSEDFSQNGLYAVAMALSPDGCKTIPDTNGAKNTMCFRSVSGKNVVCSNDSGSPLYCYSASTGEWILVGVAAFQADCDNTPEVKVLPYPG